MKIKIAFISLLFVPFLVFAQNGALPSAGLTPESPFYFFDKLGEALQRFFTFNPESKARLEITFAKERIAEIKVILEDKGVNAKGLNVAEERLNDNLSRATAILANQKQAGKDTSNLARDLSDDFDPARKALKNIFKSEVDTLEAKIDELKVKLKEARLTGNAAQVEALSKEVADLKAQKELLEQHNNKDDGDIEEKNEHFDEALGLKEEAAEKIKDAEEEKTDILKEAQEKNLDVSDGTFKTFDDFLSKAKAAFDTGNYAEAKRLAKEAKKNLKEAEKHLEKLKDAKDEAKDLNEETDLQKQELENKSKGADKKEAEQIREETKQKGEESQKNQEPPPTTTNNGSSSSQSNNETANWKIYRNEQYGFELKYPLDFKLNQQTQNTYLSKENSENFIFISVAETLSVPLMGTFGGRYLYPNKYPDITPIVPVFSEKYGSWNKDYFIVAGKGMGDTATNAYQNKNGSYYNISLYSSARQLGTPDAEAAALKDMRDSSSTDTNIFNQILSTFKFIR